MQTIAIVGASVRAAAFSALRAGLVPVGIDRFADWDLRLRVSTLRLDDYPNGIESAIARCCVDAWMYTGGIENYPELVDRLAKNGTLWGNSASALKGVRDPFQWARAFAEAAIACPWPQARAEGLPHDGSWLIKPLRGSGGAGIRPWRGQSPPARGKGVEYYFQPRIVGTPCSAVFVGAAGRAVLLGATRQLMGGAWSGASEFAYAGSIGPLKLSRQKEEQWQRIGNCLARRFALVGLFGVDAIDDGSTVWPVEVNPRYTASVEVLERAIGFQAVQLHAEACCRGTLAEPQAPSSDHCVGKAILYAPTDLVVSARFFFWARQRAEAWPWPDLADVPDVGAVIRRGQPVATFFAEASDESATQHALRARLDEARRLLNLA